MTPSIKQLKYIVAVAEQRHFGNAATACHVTQSTLSAGIQDLEEILNVQVFERTKKQVLITEKGQEIVLHAKRVLQEINGLVDATSSTSKPLCGKITLGVIPTVGPYLLPTVLAKLRKSFPELKIFLRESQTAALLEDLTTGRIDAALIALPYPINDLKKIELFDDLFHLACPADHPLANRKLLKVQHLATQPLLLLEEGHCLRQHALSACKFKGADYGVPYQCTSLSTLIQMVANDIGITLVPEMAVKSGLLTKTGLVSRSFNDKSVKRTIGMVWRSSSSKQSDLQLLAEYIKKFGAIAKKPA
ncbi:MAG: hydrogen peroxide-inducible genes activator [Betaproteobacteria bacterium]|nr:hydrogen peroxide-inducible genes activator [Betaproteobacteria bacterium]